SLVAAVNSAGARRRGRGSARRDHRNLLTGEIDMSDLVDIAIPTNARAAAESIGLTVQRSMTNGTWIRRLSRDEAEIAGEYLRDSGCAGRMVDSERTAAGAARKYSSRKS